MTTPAQMTCEEFLLRLAQYWVVVCASRHETADADSPYSRVVELLIAFWNRRRDIQAGDLLAVRYYQEQRALRVRSGELPDVVPPGFDRPFKLFYAEGSLARSIRTFASRPAYRTWRLGREPDLSRVRSLVERFERAGLDVKRDLRYVGAVVQEPVVRAATTIGFKDLLPKQAREFGEHDEHAAFDLPDRAASRAAKQAILPGDPDALLLLRVLAAFDLLELPASRAAVTAVFEHLRGNDPLRGTRLEDAFDKLKEQALVSVTRSRVAAELPIITAAGRELVRGHSSLPELTGRFDDIATAIIATREVFDDPDDILLRLTLFYEEGRRYDRALVVASSAGSPALRQHRAVLLVHAGRYDEALAALDYLAGEPVFLDEFVATFGTLTSSAALVAHGRAATPDLRRMLRASFERLGWTEELLAL